MRNQVTIQLPADLIAFLDEQKESGKAKSRNETVARALRRERRRVRAQADAAIYAAHGEPEDLRGLAEWAQDTSLDID